MWFDYKSLQCLLAFCDYDKMPESIKYIRREGYWAHGLRGLSLWLVGPVVRQNSMEGSMW